MVAEYGWVFAELFGIREWETDLLTYFGFLRYKHRADAWITANTSSK